MHPSLLSVNGAMLGFAGVAMEIKRHDKEMTKVVMTGLSDIRG